MRNNHFVQKISERNLICIINVIWIISNGHRSALSVKNELFDLTIILKKLKFSEFRE